MLIKYEKDQYLQAGIRNRWIVKPIASSRGAGISLLKNSEDFLVSAGDLYHSAQYTNEKKYSNKILQRYI